MAPSLAQDSEFCDWFERAGRLHLRPDDRLWRSEVALNTDLREVLPAVRVPALVVTHRDRPTAPLSRYLADHLPNAQHVELPGADTLPFAADSLAVLDRVEEFLTGRLPDVQPDRVLATVMFTDIVNSTGQAASMGDHRWRELLSRHDALIAEQVTRFRGRVVKSTGDGVLATFDGPARAIKCAQKIVSAATETGLEIRAGVHTGECELLGDKVAGIAVSMGARIAAQANEGEILVSATVKDLVAGSGIEFESRGIRELKGLGEWPLYAVAL